MDKDVMLNRKETLGYEELKDKDHELSKLGPTCEELAEKLGVIQSAVAQAVMTAGHKCHRLQIRIVELLSDYEVERCRSFVLRSKD